MCLEIRPEQHIFTRKSILNRRKSDLDTGRDGDQKELPKIAQNYEEGRERDGQY